MNNKVLPRYCSARATDGKSQCISRVIGADFFVDAKEHLDHFLDLVLLRLTMTADLLLHLQGSELVDGELVISERKYEHTTHLTDRHSGLLVVQEEELLNSGRAGLPPDNKVTEGVIGPLFFGRSIRAGIFDDSPGKRMEARAVIPNDTIANTRCSWIDAEIYHGRELEIQRSEIVGIGNADMGSS